jgi:hypothetical protein
MAADALAGHVAVMRDYGDELPKPRTLEQIRADRAWCGENGVEWAKSMAAPIRVRPPVGKPERVTISMDSNVLREIDAYAERFAQSRSSVLTAGAEIFLGRDVEQMSTMALKAIAAGAPDAAMDEVRAVRHARMKIAGKRLHKRNSITGELTQASPRALRAGTFDRSNYHAAAKKK